MKKILLACDLDRTILHSYRHARPDALCVEWLNGKALSYMTQTTIRLLEALQGQVCFVPVTSRSVAQYLRLRWPLVPPLAVTTNGAVCLRNGAADPTWTARAQAAIQPFRGTLETLQAELEHTGGFLTCRIVDDSYLYAHYPTVGQTCRCAERFLGKVPLDVCCSGQKIYFFPPGVDKGTGLRHLRALTGADYVFCAGDSSIDLPMLKAADLAFVPTAALAAALPDGQAIVCPEDQFFPEFLLSAVLRLTEHGFPASPSG